MAVLSDKVPTELIQVVAPPEELARRIANGEMLCGGRFEISWASGPLIGRRTSTYCASPGCLTTGYCTGARFVPHPQQHEPDGTMRKATSREAVPAAREAAKMATGRDDPRSDREIRAYAAHIYAGMARAYGGKGRW